MLTFATAIGFTALPALAEDTLKIGVLSDLTGPFAQTNGLKATEMAVADFGGEVLGKKIVVISSDHLNKADSATVTARRWIDDEGVAAIVDVPNSAVALAVNEVARQKKTILLATSPATVELTGKACGPTTFHWTYDTWMLAHGTANTMLDRGGDTWFFITSDYAFGRAIEHDSSEVVKARGGRVLGSVRAPLNTSDFSSFLLQAQSSKAKVVGLALAGADLITAVKQAHEFGLDVAGQKLVGLLLVAGDVSALGLQSAQGLLYSEAFYWDVNDDTRAWAKRFGQLNDGRIPSMTQAGTYSAVTHYLKAVKAAGTSDGMTVAGKMKEMPTDDVLFGRGSVRAEGRKIHSVYVLEVKKPSESTGPWDLAKVSATIPPDQAFRPLDQSDCPLVKK
ncbi:ABC transporter permease [Bradyrhizobium sp. CCBAU 21359]|nr:ABC transporter permease [Bradyrhizobium sp. CCBAU 21360]MDA9457589.1 ABC transporter permease [Bradyrhizobium sp. CCBAU 21359]